jgi:hypothetical protein
MVLGKCKFFWYHLKTCDFKCSLFPFLTAFLKKDTGSNGKREKLLKQIANFITNFLL